MTHIHRRGLLIGALAGVWLGGCASPENPSFPLSVSDAKTAIKEMSQEPKPLERPLVIVGGYGDPGFATDHLSDTMKPCLTVGVPVTTITFTKEKTFDECRDRLIEFIDGQYGPGAGSTVEVDIVANSMGGVIARYAADPSVGERHVAVRRMFTLSSPHRGADMAGVPTSNQLLIDMRVGSEFLEGLNVRTQSPPYEMVPYARLGDTWVGEENTALPGEVPWWVPNRPFEPAHLTAYGDPRIIADTLRRLRGETPYSTEPRAPWPESKN